MKNTRILVTLHSITPLLRVTILAAAMGVAAIVAGAQDTRAAEYSTAVTGTLTRPSPLRFDISFPATVHQQPITGRVFVFITRDSAPEPRFQVGLTSTHMQPNPPFFGLDVDQLRPGQAATIDNTVLGYPLNSLGDLPPGDYYVQAMINIYTEYRRADGHVIWAHDDQWEGQHFERSPGNLYSAVQRVHLDPASSGTVRLQLANVVPPIQVPPDTRWIKRIKIQSRILTAFWGRPIYLGAVVLLPRDYDAHPDVRYPVDYESDHFTLDLPYAFRTEPPADSAVVGQNRWHSQQKAYQFYQDWVSDDFPRMLVVSMLHPTPFYDDSYMINSPNNGPYGDAIMQELIPYIESHFRIIQQPYARVVSGGSTGGWEALAQQTYHPSFFGGAWVYYPDPVDFRRLFLTDIYADTNAYHPNGSAWLWPERPITRTPEGQVLVTLRQQTQMESVLGSHGRSAQLLGGWSAAFGPVGPDGYPLPLWDPKTGVIDHQLALYRRDHGFDLRYYLQKNWSDIGPQLVGKLHLYSGDMDHFYLNVATYLLEDFLESTRDPYYGGSFEYGRPMKGHALRPTSPGDMFRTMAREITKNAPAGTESRSWHYR